MQPGRKVIGAGSTLDGGSRGSDTTGINDDDHDDHDDDDDNCVNESWKNHWDFHTVSKMM